MTVLDARTVTARKSHVCEDCGRDIVPGEQYRRTTSVGDDGFDTWKCCPQCHALVRDLWDADVRSEDDLGCECYAYLPEVDWATFDLDRDDLPTAGVFSVSWPAQDATDD